MNIFENNGLLRKTMGSLKSQFLDTASQTIYLHTFNHNTYILSMQAVIDAISHIVILI